MNVGDRASMIADQRTGPLINVATADGDVGQPQIAQQAG